MPYLSPGHFEKNSFVRCNSAHLMPRRPPNHGSKIKSRRTTPQSERWFVVFEGTIPGVVQGWHLCQERTSGFAGSRFAAFADRPAAQHAWRSDRAWIPPPDASTDCSPAGARSERYPIGVNTTSRINRWRSSQGEHLARLGRKIRADKESRAEAEGTEEPGIKAGGKPGPSSSDEGGGTGDECSPSTGTFSSQGPRRDSDDEEEKHGGAGPPLQAA